MALQPAIVGLPRVGNTRVGYIPASMRGLLYVNGVSRTHYYDRYSVDINDDLNELPNTCAFECFGFTPVQGQVVKMLSGSIKDFEGTIVSITERHDKLNARTVYRVACTDYTRSLDADLVTKAYGSQSATTTAQDIITNFTSGFTQVNIAAGLPTVAAIQFKMTPVSSALRQLCDAIGGDTYVDYDKDVHVFVTETTVVPDTINASNTAFKKFKYTNTIDRVANRIYVEGMGSTFVADVAVGETIIPLASMTMFDPAGGLVTTGNQILSYTGRTDVTPGTAPTVSASTGTGLTDGAYSYAFTYVTAAGESLPSPLGTMTAGLRSAPSAVASVSDGGDTGSSLIGAGTYQYALTAVYPGGGETTPGSLTAITVAANHDILIGIPALPSGATGLNLYRTTAGGGVGTLRLVFNIFAAPTTATDRLTDATLAGRAAAPTVNTAQLNQAALTAILVGPSGTTDRKIYRTVAAGSQLKLVFSIGNNTATTSSDSTADGSLGANAPTSDTSGLSITGFSTTSGATSAGATSMTLVSATAFKSSGGWARIQDTTIRYTGTTATTLTGIPASGAGSVTSSIPSASLVQGLVTLTGVPSSGTGSVVSAINKGDALNLLVQRDDTTSQASYGIRKAYIQDRRLSVSGAQARGDAELTLRKDPLITGSFITTDTKVRSGRRVTIAMGSEWGIAGTFTINKVRMFWTEGDPRLQREVTFSSNSGQADLFRLLRRIRENQQQDAA